MNQGKRKYPEIDVMKIYVEANYRKWNAFLTKCVNHRDLETVLATLYGMQSGMDKVSAQKLNDDKMNVWFCRITQSLEKTAKKIYRLKYSNPCDDPAKAKQWMEFKSEKKKRDEDFIRLITKARF